MFASASNFETRRKLVIGLVIVILIATTWVGSTQTAKSTFSGKFRAPFFLIWFRTAFMVVVFPLTMPLYFFFVRGEKRNVHKLWRLVLVSMWHVRQFAT